MPHLGERALEGGEQLGLGAALEHLSDESAARLQRGMAECGSEQGGYVVGLVIDQLKTVGPPVSCDRLFDRVDKTLALLRTWDDFQPATVTQVAAELERGCPKKVSGTF